MKYFFATCAVILIVIGAAVGIYEVSALVHGMTR